MNFKNFIEISIKSQHKVKKLKFLQIQFFYQELEAVVTFMVDKISKFVFNERRTETQTAQKI